MHTATQIHNGLSDIAAAKILGLKPQTLRNWRFQMRGPAYSKLGKRVVYSLQDLESYQKKHRVDPEASN